MGERRETRSAHGARDHRRRRTAGAALILCACAAVTACGAPAVRPAPPPPPPPASDRQLVIDGARDRLDDLARVLGPCLGLIDAVSEAAGKDGASPLAAYLRDARAALDPTREPATLRAVVKLAGAAPAGAPGPAGAIVPTAEPPPADAPTTATAPGPGGEELTIAVSRGGLTPATLDLAIATAGDAGEVTAVEVTLLVGRGTARVMVRREGDAEGDGLAALARAGDGGDPRGLVAIVAIRPDGGDLRLRSPVLARVLADVERDLYRPLAARLRGVARATRASGPGVAAVRGDRG